MIRGPGRPELSLSQPDYKNRRSRQEEQTSGVYQRSGPEERTSGADSSLVGPLLSPLSDFTKYPRCGI